MAQGDAVPAGLRTALDGYDVGRGIGRVCPGCEHEFEPDDRLVVTTERPPRSGDWNVPSVVCSECGRRAFSDDERRPDVEQVLVAADLAATPMALVIDGESARLLDRSPATGGPD